MKRALLLKPKLACEPLSFLLEEEGVEPCHWPVLDVAWPDDARGLRAAAEGIGRFRWVVVDAPQAVRVLSEAIAAAGSAAGLSAVQWLAPDEVTARSINHHGWIPRVVGAADDLSCGHSHVHPHEHTAWATIAQALLGDDDVLIAHEMGCEPQWAQVLRESRARVVCVGAWVRREVGPFNGPPPDVIVADSPSAVEALFERHRELVQVPFVAAGPATAVALKSLGAQVVKVASRPTTEGMLDAALSALSNA